MMIKTFARLEHRIGSKDFYFQCDIDSPLKDCHDSLCHFTSYVLEQERKAIEAQKKEEPPSPETQGTS